MCPGLFLEHKSLGRSLALRLWKMQSIIYHVVLEFSHLGKL